MSSITVDGNKTIKRTGASKTVETPTTQPTQQPTTSGSVYDNYANRLKENNQSYLDTLGKNFDMYRSMLDRNKINSQAQLASATEKSRAMMDNYLKALGLYGSGAGQSEYANLGANYQNSLASINNEYDDNLMNAQMDYNERVANENKEFNNNLLNAELEQQNQNDTAFTNAMSEMREIGATPEQMREYYEENKGKISEGLQSQWENVLNVASEKASKERDYNYNELNNSIKNAELNETNIDTGFNLIEEKFKDNDISEEQYYNANKNLIKRIIEDEYEYDDERDLVKMIEVVENYKSKLSQEQYKDIKNKLTNQITEVMSIETLEDGIDEIEDAIKEYKKQGKTDKVNELESKKQKLEQKIKQIKSFKL